MSQKRFIEDGVESGFLKRLNLEAKKMEGSTKKVVEFVLMPWEDETYITHHEVDALGNKRSLTYKRYDLIVKLLNVNNKILDCHMLGDVIKSYNIIFNENGKQIRPSWNMIAVKKYIDECSEDERREFFDDGGVLSCIRNLALQLKDLVPCIHLLKAGSSSFNTFHQLQVASILASGFLCTFPKRNRYDPEFKTYPYFNFHTLFEVRGDSTVSKKMVQKVRCIIHYFKRIHQKQPTGKISFKRVHVPDNKFPRFERANQLLTNIEFDSDKRIENQTDYLQMDFANKMVGGGVLAQGCVQEEIRFLICPELITSRLFTETLQDNEALLVTGVEQFCNYKGYASSFEFDGDYVDNTQTDGSGHRTTQVIMLDALYFYRPQEQFREGKILRELKKAYVGFKPHTEDEQVKPIATGNWGCGVYHGDPGLKCLIQLMAASQFERNLLYCTFNDEPLRVYLSDMCNMLKVKNVTVGKLFRIIKDYHRDKSQNQTLFDYIRTCLTTKSNILDKFTNSVSTPKTKRAEVKERDLRKSSQKTGNRSNEHSHFSYERRESEEYLKNLYSSRQDEKEEFSFLNDFEMKIQDSSSDNLKVSPINNVKVKNVEKRLEKSCHQLDAQNSELNRTKCDKTDNDEDLLKLYSSQSNIEDLHFSSDFEMEFETEMRNMNCDNVPTVSDDRNTKNDEGKRNVCDKLESTLSKPRTLVEIDMFAVDSNLPSSSDDTKETNKEVTRSCEIRKAPSPDLFSDDELSTAPSVKRKLSQSKITEWFSNKPK